MDKKLNHQANIVRIKEIKTHGNADTLEIIPIGEYQVVSKKGQFNVGDLVVYIQPDSVVPQTEPFRFIWNDYIDPLNPNTIVPEKRRRITVRKFRGEWSEGLLLPTSDFGLHDNGNGYCSLLETHYFKEGDDVSDFLKITHYDPDAGNLSLKGENSNAPKLRKKYPQSFRGWYNYVKRRIRNFFRIGPNTDGSSDNISLGIPTYDVDALKNYPNVFIEGEEVIVTEKIHGSNARYIFLDGIMYAGSRNLWKSPTSSCIFRKNLKENPWIEEWCRAHEGYVLWGELTPTQKGYEYGSTKPQFFPFDIRKPDGTWLDDTDTDFMDLVVPLIGHSVPVLYQGPYNLEKIKSFVDGDSLVPNAKNIREGVVIKTNPERHVHGVGRAQLKVVSNAFLMKDNK